MRAASDSAVSPGCASTILTFCGTASAASWALMRRNEWIEAHEPRVDGGREGVGGENQPEKPAVQTNGAEAEAPLLALGDGGRGIEAGDLLGLDRGRLDAVDPARGDRARDRRGLPDRDAVEAQRLAARFADADQRRRLVLERKAVGRLEGEAELGMNEGVSRTTPCAGLSPKAMPSIAAR